MKLLDILSIYSRYITKNIMKLSNITNFLIIFFVLPLFLISCKGPDGKFKLPGGDARKTPADPAKRVEQNIREGKGFRLSDSMKNRGSGVFEFASSNGLWKASLDVIEFMPLSSVNYSGGIIVTDWYSDNENLSESLKITVRFLSNEIRSDAVDLKIFYKKCDTLNVCTISEGQTNLNNELKKQILKKASIYKTQSKTKK